MSVFITKNSMQQNCVDRNSRYFFPIYDLLHIEIFALESVAL